MPLPANFPIISPVAPVQTGIIVGISPVDPTFDMEIQRAPDSSGAPGTPVTINRIPPFAIGSGTHYTDRLPVTGALYYYRFRHVRDGWTAGAYGPWSRAGTAKFLDNVSLPPAVPVPFTPIPNNAAATVALESIGGDATTAFGPSGRDDLIFNGDCENGLGYWIVADAGTFGNIPKILANRPRANLQIDSSAPYKGTKSLRFDSNAVDLSYTLVQVNRAEDSTADGEMLLLRTQPGTTYRLRCALKLSSTGGVTVAIGFAYWAGAQLFTGQTTVVVSPTASYAIYEMTFTVPAGNFYIAPIIRLDYNSAVKTLYVDDVHTWRLKQASDYQDGSVGTAALADFAVTKNKLETEVAEQMFGPDLIMNGDFEDGFSWWGAVGTGTVSIETGASRYKGAKSLKIVSAGDSTNTSARTSGRGSDDLAGSLAQRFVRVNPGDVLRFRGALMAAASSTATVQIATYDDNKSSATFANLISTTSLTWVEQEVFFVVPAGKYYFSLFPIIGGAAPQTGWWDEIHCWRAMQRADLYAGAAIVQDTQTGLSRTANTEASVGTTVLPAGVLKANAERIRIHLHGTISAALTAGGTVKVNFGATTVLNYSIPTGVSDSFHAIIDITRTGATTQVSSSLNFDNQGGAAVLTRAAPAETLANAITIDYRLKSDGTRSVTLEGIAVEYLAK